MEIEKLKDRLLEWDGVDAWDNGEYIQVDYHGVFDLLKEAATALEQLAAYEDTGLTPEEIKSLRAEWAVNLKALESYRAKEADHE